MVFFLNESVVVNSEYLGNLCNNLLYFSILNSLFESVEFLFIPCLYVLCLLISLIVVVVVLSRKAQQISCELIEVRVKDVSTDIRKSSCAEFLIFVKESDYCTFSNL